MKKILFLFIVLFAGSVFARDQIKVVGSSTVYPFATVVAERFGKTSGFKTPVIESTGSGGGLKLFCDSMHHNYDGKVLTANIISKFIND